MVSRSVIDAETLDTSALARSGSRGTLIAVQLALLVVLCCCGLLYVESDFDALPLIDVASWAVVVIVVYAFWSWRRMGGSFFDPYSLFLISATLFNGGLAFLQVVGLNEEGVLAGEFTAETTLTALFLTASGLAAMNLGALIAARKGKPLLPESAISTPMETLALRRAGWLLLAISIVPSVLLGGRALIDVIGGGYFALYQRTAEVSFAAAPQILASFFVPAILCLLAGSKHSRAYLVVCSMLMLSYSATLLVVGARYGAIAPLLAFAWVWDRCVKPVSPGRYYRHCAGADGRRFSSSPRHA